MEITTILTADVLDIIFDGRNKAYGAYELRRSYRRRLLISLSVTLLVILLLLAGYVLAGRKTQAAAIFEVPDTVIVEMQPKEKQPEPPVVKPPAAAPKTQMVKFTVPKIEPDDKVPENEKPPANEALEDVKIGAINREGVKEDGTEAPPSDDNGKGIIELPKKEDDDDDGPMIHVQIESEYPGGPAAWQRFLHRNLHYPQDAIDNEIQGTVIVQFIVDREGNVSDVAAVSGPPELRAEAVRVIKKSGKWTPAIQNGRQVKSYKKQPVGFRLDTE